MEGHLLGVVGAVLFPTEVRVLECVLVCAVDVTVESVRLLSFWYELCKFVSLPDGGVSE